MLKEIKKNNRVLYLCECGLIYTERIWAERCEAMHVENAVNEGSKSALDYATGRSGEKSGINYNGNRTAE